MTVAILLASVAVMVIQAWVISTYVNKVSELLQNQRSMVEMVCARDAIIRKLGEELREAEAKLGAVGDLTDQ